MRVSQPICRLREGAGREQLLTSWQRELTVSFIPVGDAAHKTQAQMGAVQPVLPPVQGAAVMVRKRWEAGATLIRKPPYGCLCTCSVLITGKFKIILNI